MNKRNRTILRRLYSIKARCYNEHRKDYKYYGRRGIKVCGEWLEHSFRFLLWFNGERLRLRCDLLGVPDRAIDVDRINPDGDYSPDNCRLVLHRDNVIRSINRDGRGRFAASVGA